MKKIYFASPLFDQAVRGWNQQIVNSLREQLEVDIYLPQENDAINDKSDSTKEVTSLDIFDADTDILKMSDILIANLDGGLEIDSGVACEIGYFASLCANNPHKKIIGIITDVRWNATNGAADEQHGVYKNLYVIGAVKKYGNLITTGNQEITSQIIEYINSL